MENTNSNQENNLPIISVKNLSKKYCRDLKHSLWYGVKDTAREFLFRRKVDPTLRTNEFWVLKDISFELYPGESLAIIGDNGAGKSTLLKILYGLIKPDVGEVRVRGKVGALVELGTGFDPVLSGRENVSVNASLLGFPASEIESLIEKVIDFSELGEFIDTPVQYYSSGMVARLAYAIAANLNPTLFLIDEVLAVGDIDFQRKCLNQMTSYLSAGGSLILISHAPYHIQAVCKRGIFLQAGQVEFQGTAVEAMTRYYESRLQNLPDQQSDLQDKILSQEQPVIITDVSIDAVNEISIRTGGEVKISIKYRALKIDAKVGCAFMFSTQDDLICIAGDININLQTLQEGDGLLECFIPKLPLLGGTYLLKVVIFEIETLWSLDNMGWSNAPLSFKVEANLDNLFISGKLVLDQLVTLDVNWR